MEATRTFTARAGNMAPRSGVLYTGVARQQASPTRRSVRLCRTVWAAVRRRRDRPWLERGWSSTGSGDKNLGDDRPSRCLEEPTISSTTALREAGAALRQPLRMLFNPVTFRHVDDARHPLPGWRCWEVGVGGPSVPAVAVAGRVGTIRPGPRHRHRRPPGPGRSAGEATSTFADTMWPPMTRRPTAFDLVHARLALIHVPQRDQALRRMAASVRAGGWLLIEDFDPAMQPYGCPDVYGPEQARRTRYGRGSVSSSLSGAPISEFGRRLPRIVARRRPR